MNEYYDFDKIRSFRTQPNPFWIKYENLISNMSKEELNFIAKQEKVILAKSNLMNTFIDYLFEKEKNNFITTDEAKQITEIYLSEIKNASEQYINRTESLENENAELKKYIEELLKKGVKPDENKQSATT
jgi:RNase adaptor protein for sRNA GlmZ degradation